MNKRKYGPVVRRWGFYVKGRLAYAGVAERSTSHGVSICFTETEQHAHTSSLPQRIRLEKKIREQACVDIKREVGIDCCPVIHFESFSKSEKLVAGEVFGAAEINPLI